METESTPKVLVADDNAVDRKVLSTIVSRAGYEVVQAVDGNDALVKFNEEHPDLVLLDALMPGKDGFEVAQEIRGFAILAAICGLRSSSSRMISTRKSYPLPLR